MKQQVLDGVIISEDRSDEGLVQPEDEVMENHLREPEMGPQDDEDNVGTNKMKKLHMRLVMPPTEMRL